MKKSLYKHKQKFELKLQFKVFVSKTLTYFSFYFKAKINTGQKFLLVGLIKPGSISFLNLNLFYKSL